MYYVNQRWLGGTLTNFTTIRKRIGRLLELEKCKKMVLSKYYLKRSYFIKERNGKTRENLGGIKEMTELPGVMFIVDPKKKK